MILKKFFAVMFRPLRPLRLCARYSEFRLRCSRAGSFVVNHVLRFEVYPSHLFGMTVLTAARRHSDGRRNPGHFASASEIAKTITGCRLEFILSNVEGAA